MVAIPCGFDPRHRHHESPRSNGRGLSAWKASFVIMDELHGVKDRNLYEVMRQSMAARRQPLLIMITTAGTVRECIFDEMYQYAAGVADGAIADPHFLPVMYELDDRSEWTDPAAWIKANPALGAVKKTDDLTQKVERAKQNRSELSGVLYDITRVDTFEGYKEDLTLYCSRRVRQ